VVVAVAMVHLSKGRKSLTAAVLVVQALHKTVIAHKALQI
jgi:hypothetical protein